MVQQLVKRKRGRPRKDQVALQGEGDSPLWAIVDQLTLIHDDLHRLIVIAETTEGIPHHG